MSLNQDYIIERKRHKKQIAKWKLISLLVVLILTFYMNKNYFTNINIQNTESIGGSEYIARILINSEITYDFESIRNIDNISDRKNAKALIVTINSPGGSTVGSEMLYNSILKLSKIIPVVVVMGEVAASGGYMAALGGDYIIAHNGTITGSIGVLMQSAEITELADKLGVKFTNFKSDILKANPNLTEKVTPEAYQAIMDSVYEVQDYFVSLVAARRNLDIEYVKKVADGRIYSGRQAMDLKLIDEVGNEDTAIEWLEKERKITKDLKIIDINLKRKKGFWDVVYEDFNVSIVNLFSSKFKGLKSQI